MPRVIAFRIGPMWVAFRLNDVGEVGPRRFRFTENMARLAAATA